MIHHDDKDDGNDSNEDFDDNDECEFSRENEYFILHGGRHSNGDGRFNDSRKKK